MKTMKYKVKNEACSEVQTNSASAMMQAASVKASFPCHRVLSMAQVVVVGLMAGIHSDAPSTSSDRDCEPGRSKFSARGEVSLSRTCSPQTLASGVRAAAQKPKRQPKCHP